MPGKMPESGGREPRAGGAESSDREGRIVARASGVAAAVAVASIGLAYVAAQAGLGDAGTATDGVARSDRGTRVAAHVPEVDSPVVATEPGLGTVLVQPHLVEPERAPIPVAREGHGAGAAPSEPGGDGGPAVSDAPPADDASPPAAGDPEPVREDGWVEWRRWWDAQRDSWAEILHELSRELDAGSEGSSIEQVDWSDDRWRDRLQDRQSSRDR
ncbi:hypothetical protein [Demequina sp. SO4-18]|uniref:hypothetical protein n=1 Tax=Demequina sp. SO4-18 TaxID=3401026 RepID=UPI003B58C195